MSTKLTAKQWHDIFQLRCRSKCGETLTRQEMALIRRAYAENPTRYGSLDDAVFNATAPFGSVKH